jgi:prolyl 4-hydroxylase
MWPATYFGQEHWVTTKETHFVVQPPSEKLEPLIAQPKERILSDQDPRMLREYRDPDHVILNMSLTVMSVSPRIFEINDFLSDAEVEHILKLAQGIDLSLSSTGEVLKDGEEAVNDGSRRTRTSYNSWVPREKSPILDAIYRRAADLMRIDESLLRARHPDERGDVTGIKSLAEHLQLVHYDENQEYTVRPLWTKNESVQWGKPLTFQPSQLLTQAHHDFGYSDVDAKQQDARFATLLLYLNSPEAGGETSFPRWRNAESFHELKVSPSKNRAVLFYSQCTQFLYCSILVLL